MNSTLLRFANYARRSSEGEGKQVASIPAQESAAKALVERDQLNVAKWLSEDRSAMIPNNRPVFDALITMLVPGLVVVQGRGETTNVPIFGLVDPESDAITDTLIEERLTSWRLAPPSFR